MKYKTTRKAVVADSPRLVSVGYCDLSALLRYHSPVAYTCGVYGWNFDVYEVYGLTICTGYRGLPGAGRTMFASMSKLHKMHWSAWTGKRRKRKLNGFCLNFAHRYNFPSVF